MKKPRWVRFWWKYRSAGFRSLQPGPLVELDYEADADAALAGIQNLAEFLDIPFSPASETIDAFAQQIAANGKRPRVRLENTSVQVSLASAGGVNNSLQTIEVSKPAKAESIQPGTVLEFEDPGSEELVTVQSVTPGPTEDTLSVLRGEHGTAAAAHAEGTPLRRKQPSVPMRSETLSRVPAGEFPAPSGLLATPLDASVALSWQWAGSSDERARLDGYNIYWSTSQDHGPDPAEWPAGNLIEGGKQTLFAHVDLLPGVQHFYRVQARPKQGPPSALSGPANAVPLAGEPPEDLSTPTEPPAIEVRDAGGQEGAFQLLVGIAFAPTGGRGGVTKSELQIADAAAAFDAQAGFDQTIYSEELGRPPQRLFAPVPRAGTYQISARLFNAAAQAWTDYSQPVTATTVPGVVDADTPGAPSFATVKDNPSNLGNSVLLEVGLPDADLRTIWGIEIQALPLPSVPVATATDATNCQGLLASGSGAQIEHGKPDLTTATASLTPGAYAGKTLYIYKSIDAQSGRIERPFSYVIAANTADTITIQPAPDGSLFSPPAEETVNYNVYEGFRPRSDFGHWDTPLWNWQNGAYQTQVLISDAYFWRFRWLGWFGHGPWMWRDLGQGTTDRSQAAAFQPALIQREAIGDKEVNAQKLDDEALDDARIFSASLPAVAVVGNLALVDTTKFTVALLTTDAKLYRWDGAQWTRATDGADIDADTVQAGALTAGVLKGRMVAGDLFATGDPGEARVEISAAAGLELHSPTARLAWSPTQGTDAGKLFLRSSDTEPGALIFDGIASISAGSSRLSFNAFAAVGGQIDFEAGTAVGSKRWRDASFGLARDFIVEAARNIALDAASLFSVDHQTALVSGGPTTVRTDLFALEDALLSPLMTAVPGSIDFQAGVAVAAGRSLASWLLEVDGAGNTLLVDIDASAASFVNARAQPASGDASLTFDFRSRGASQSVNLRLLGPSGGTGLRLNWEGTFARVESAANLVLESPTNSLEIRENAASLAVRDKPASFPGLAGSTVMAFGRTIGDSTISVISSATGIAGINFGGADQEDEAFIHFNNALNDLFINRDLLPSISGVALGSSGSRFSELWATTVNQGDTEFANGWRLREHPWKRSWDGLKESRPGRFLAEARLARAGLEIVDGRGRLVAVVHSDGYIYARGLRDLSRLPG